MIDNLESKIEPKNVSYQYSELQGFRLIEALIEFARQPLAFSLKSARESGDIVSLSFGSAKFYLFNHPSLIEEILSKHEGHSVKDYSYRALQNILGQGLILSHGDTWKTNRRFMQSAFSRARLNDYSELTVANTRSTLDSWQSGEVRDLHQELSLLTVKVITHSLFGVETTEIASEITQALKAIMLQYFHQAEWLFFLPKWLPTAVNWQAYGAKKRLDKIVNQIIEQRKQLPQGSDLLSMMLEAQKESGQLSDRYLRDEVMTLLIAGHDTTANALSWTLMLLAQNPAVEAKLVAEINSVLGKKSPTDRDLEQLPYTEMVLKESMRLYPPAWAIGRELTQDCNIGGYDFTRGTVIYFIQWAVHRDPRFFDEPDRFNPDRWQDLAKHLPRQAYFPFGAGARACIGKAFSMMEMKIVLAMIIQRFSLSLLDKQKIEPLPSFTLRPKQGLKMKITAKV